MRINPWLLLVFAAGGEGNESSGHDCWSVTCLGANNAGRVGRVAGSAHLLALVGARHLQQFAQCARSCAAAHRMYSSLRVDSLNGPQGQFGFNLMRLITLQAINGGLVMVAFYPHFVSCSGQATLHDVVGRWKTKTRERERKPQNIKHNKLFVWINFCIAYFAAHINHIREVAGIDHVGIGAGYDGVNL